MQQQEPGFYLTSIYQQEQEQENVQQIDRPTFYCSLCRPQRLSTSNQPLSVISRNQALLVPFVFTNHGVSDHILARVTVLRKYFAASVVDFILIGY